MQVQFATQFTNLLDGPGVAAKSRHGFSFAPVEHSLPQPLGSKCVSFKCLRPKVSFELTVSGMSTLADVLDEVKGYVGDGDISFLSGTKKLNLATVVSTLDKITIMVKPSKTGDLSKSSSPVPTTTTTTRTTFTEVDDEPDVEAPNTVTPQSWIQIESVLKADLGDEQAAITLAKFKSIV
ncbi:hypothetical protein DAMA08_014560 [Martiniozyma asiatica (nom. inval.)]|nr:hypothetical protein DAMA08_014560 [Martiniozyma asiatica]